MTVDLVVNRELYEDICPSESSDSDCHEDDLSDSEPENEAMKIFSKETEKIQNLIREASEEQASANTRLHILDQYGQSFASPRPDNPNASLAPDNLSAGLAAYKEERKKIFQDHAASAAKTRELEDELSRLKRKNRHVQKAAEKNRKKASLGKLRKSMKKQQTRQEKAQAKRRLKEERVSFWPKKVYCVVLSLDTNFDMTPSVSRRDSIDSLAKPALPSSPKADSISIAKRSPLAQDSRQIGLSISYITQCAWWSPRYDLSLTTTTGSGMITYRAEFCNRTSESWRDAKIILSTSQTAFQDLGEAIPNMEPWHICLARGFGQSSMEEALLSRSEMQHNRKGELPKSNKFQEPRGVLFGLADNNSLFHKFDDKWQELDAMKRRAPFSFQPREFDNNAVRGSPSAFGNFGTANAQPSEGFGAARVQPSGLFGTHSGPTSALQSMQPSAPAFGSNVPAASSSSFFQQSQQIAGSVVPSNDNRETLFGSNRPRIRRVASADHSEADFSAHGVDTETVIPQDPTIEFEESNWEETGLTATYDVPGVRTIPPSQTTRRHKIASIALQSVQFSYVLVPKLREAAFLKARLCNNSSITLLKGPVGLTLDGSFLGNTKIPRCSAGDAFSLNLGVDPGITVTYQKPVVRRNQVGVFQKEGSCIFTRSLMVTNTKAKSVLEGMVLDQVPVSEDEKLKVEVLQPRGLKYEGDQTKSGKAVTGDAVKNRSSSGSVLSTDGVRGTQGAEDTWGQAVATLKKAGEIRWKLKLNPGQRVRLDLEYEARFPSSERIIGK